MRRTVVVSRNKGSVQIMVAAGFAGVGKTVVASLFDGSGANPEPLPIKAWNTVWSGIEITPERAVDHIVYLQFNAASLVSTPELVSAIVSVRQGAEEIEKWNGDPTLVEAAEVIQFRILIDVEERK